MKLTKPQRDLLQAISRYPMKEIHGASKKRVLANLLEAGLIKEGRTKYSVTKQGNQLLEAAQEPTERQTKETATKAPETKRAAPEPPVVPTGGTPIKVDSKLLGYTVPTDGVVAIYRFKDDGTAEQYAHSTGHEAATKRLRRELRAASA